MPVRAVLHVKLVVGDRVLAFPKGLAADAATGPRLVLVDGDVCDLELSLVVLVLPVGDARVGPSRALWNPQA
eukprot:8219158-Pyramimonas_sp.AAC.1